MDLTTSFPRSAHDKFLGVASLGRAVDKGTATAHGNVGEYHYNCPLDQNVFGFLGVEAEKLMDAIKKSPAEIEAYLKPIIAKKSQTEIDQFNTKAGQFGPQPGTEGHDYFLEQRKSIAPDRTDVTTWPDLLDLEEKRNVPQRVPA